MKIQEVILRACQEDHLDAGGRGHRTVRATDAALWPVGWA